MRAIQFTGWRCGRKKSTGGFNFRHFTLPTTVQKFLLPFKLSSKIKFWLQMSTFTEVHLYNEIPLQLFGGPFSSSESESRLAGDAWLVESVRGSKSLVECQKIPAVLS